MNNELFDPGIDNLPMPVDGIEPDLEMLMQREQLMEDIDSIVEDFCPFGTEGNSELVRVLCDAVVRNFPVK